MIFFILSVAKVEDIVLTIYNIPFVIDYFDSTSAAFASLEKTVINEVG